MEQIRLSNGSSYFTFFPKMGACLNELSLEGKTILRAAKNDDEFTRLTKEGFNGAQLFPFPNRIRDGKYQYDGKSYHLFPNEVARNHALHGLVFDKEFQVEILESNSIVKTNFSLSGSEGFPFKMQVQNNLTLQLDALFIETTVKNTGETKAPYGHGWHPYFYGSGNIDACALKMPIRDILKVDAGLIPTGSLVSCSDFQELTVLENKKLDTCFRISNDGDIEFENPIEGFSIHIETRGYDFCQVYLPDDRTCIAIEPQTCAPDAFNNHIGLLELEPGESKSFEMRISLIET